MKRILTISILSIVTLFLLVIVAMGVFLATLDLNDYKEKIENTIEKKIGRHIIFEDGFTHSFFPLGLKTGRAYILDEDIYGADPFLQVKEVSLKADLTALLHGDIVIEELALSGLTAKFATSTTGKNNWDNQAYNGSITSAVATPLDEGKEAPAHRKTQLKDNVSVKRKLHTQIKSIKVTDASVTYTNLQDNSSWVVEHAQVHVTNLGENTDMALSLSGDLLANKHPATIDLNASIRISNDQTAQILISSCKLSNKKKSEVLPELTASASLFYDANLQNLSINDLQGSLNKTTFSGTFAVMLPNSPNLEKGTFWDIRGELQLGDIFIEDLSRKLTMLLEGDPIKRESHAVTEALKIKEQSRLNSSFAGNSFNGTAPYLDEIKEEESSPIVQKKGIGSLAKGYAVIDAKIHSIVYKGAILKNITIKPLLSKGKALIPFTFGTYGGEVQGSTNIFFDTSVPSWQLNAIAKNCKAELLPLSIAKNNNLTGTIQASAHLFGKGFSSKILPTITGRFESSMEGGNVHGFNIIPKDLATLYNIPDAFPLESASFSATIKKGVISTSDIKVTSPLIAVSGRGSANIIKNSVALDFDIFAHHPPAIPLLLRGQLNHPTVSIDVKRLSRDALRTTLESSDGKKIIKKATKEINQKVNKEVERSSKKIKEKAIKNILNKVKFHL